MISFNSPNGSPSPGYRLHKLEVYNWGTFDSTRGNVFTADTNGQMALLIGQNGSGKSTLVDALLTLLVRPKVRNYNVAAGAKKRERDERSYIKGAYDRRSSQTDNEANVQYLRPGHKHYSCLLACFRNESINKSFTVAMILFVTANGQSEKVYCFANDERSIAADFAGLTSMDKLPRQMQDRGFRATSSYTEYHGWFVKVTGARPKAMDMLNQTVAVKDIESLNTFIRDHMLETNPWADRVDSLLDHFTQLSQAHQSLVRVRRQSELLQPIARLGERYRQQVGQLHQAEQTFDAVDSFFRRKTIELLTPRISQQRRELAAVQRRRKRLTRQITETSDELRRLQNDIENGGTDRSGRIPLLLQAERSRADTKLDAARRMNERLAVLEFSPVKTRTQFRAAARKLGTISAKLSRAVTDIDRQRDQRIVERRELQQTIEQLTTEAQALKLCRNNVPAALHRIRRDLCVALQIPENQLPFAAELIRVHPEQLDWESSIEMALGRFGQSLLVPDEHYAAVSKYIEKTKLVDGESRGQKLVYLKAGVVAKTAAASPVLHPHSMLRKLRIRQGHPLAKWVRRRLLAGHDIQCCRTISEFHRATGPAMTRQRHISFGNGRLEKDDREQITSRRHYVLGWDNQQKQQLLAERIKRLSEGMKQVDERIEVLDQQRGVVTQQQSAVAELQSIERFEAIDVSVHEQAIAELISEQAEIESGNDVVRQLQKKLTHVQSRLEDLNQQRDHEVGSERLLQSRIEADQQTVAAAKQTLADRKADHSLAAHADCFADLESSFAKRPLTAENLRDREPEFLKSHRTKLDALRHRNEPIQTRLTTAMNRFLREFADERADLEAQADYLDSFLGLLQRIEDEDLPRHEQRFRERLNDKVTQEVGFLNGALQTEASEIRSKIQTLNKSLARLEYRPGTFMKLDPRAVRDREISEFRAALSACLADKFDGRHDADETRFLKIEKLIKRLREEERWRRKVTDVRRWFDFAALEIEAETGNERSCYTDSAGQSGGEKAKLAFTILVAAIAYQYDIDPEAKTSDRFHFVVVDEMFSKVDDKYAEYALELFRRFGLQLLIVAPLDAKARVTESYVGCYLHVVKDEANSHSELYTMNAREFQDTVTGGAGHPADTDRLTSTRHTPK